MKKVNLFIVGAPKCGTTAMVEYLSKSSQIFFPNIKEPHYFCDDFPEIRRVRDESEYASLYPSASDSCSYFGDASVWYLYSELSARKIFEHNPDAKILIMIRNPIGMLPSLHNQLVFSGREDVLDFNKAWLFSSERRKGVAIPKNSLEPSHLFYDSVCKYYDQISRYKDVFPDENVKLVLFEDFISETGDVVGEVFDFLGLDRPIISNYNAVNRSRAHRFPVIMHALQFPPFPFSVIKRMIKSVGFVQRNPPLRKLYSYFSVDKKVQGASAETIEMIKAVYRDDAERLMSMFGVDVSEWLK